MNTRYCLLLLLFASISGSVIAEDNLIKNDRFNIRFGNYSILKNESTISLVGSNLLAVSLSTTRDLKMDDKQNTAFIDGYYRFDPYHSVHYSWFRNSRKGETVVDEEFVWGDETYPVNANLKSEYTTNVYKLAYLFSFHHERKVELGLLLGLHITGIDVSLVGTLNGDTIADEGTSFTAPLPVAGFKMSYDIIPDKLIWWNKAEFFYIGFDAYEGGLSDISSNIEWRVFKNVGIGTAFRGTRLTLEADKDGKQANFEDTNSGVTLYFSVYL